MYRAQYYDSVNSYIWLPANTSKKPKLKGRFEDEPDYHKDHSMLIVPKALREYYVNGKSVEETIRSSREIYDFCKMVKAKGCKFKAEWYDKELQKHEEKQGKVVRYYVRKSKGHYGNVKLMKYLPPIKTETYTDLHKLKSPNQMDIFDVLGVDDCKQINDRVQNVEAKNYVEIFNRFVQKEFDDYKLDYSYYIDECYKIINAIK